jgi:lycopene cyclase domain-containing protein
MTYLALSLVVLTLLGAVCTPVLRELRGWPVVSTALHLVVLTLVFDSLMIGVGLVSYDPEKILGVYLWDAPIEDFAYSIAAAIAMPTLWTVLARRRARRAAGAADGGLG